MDIFDMVGLDVQEPTIFHLNFQCIMAYPRDCAQRQLKIAKSLLEIIQNRQ